MPKRHWFGRLKCTVCGFPFSDWHHVYPQAAGGKRSRVIALCPNHHRYTHMIYAMVDAGASDVYIWQFAEAHFDEAFLIGFMSNLLLEYRHTQAAMTLARTALAQWLMKAALNKLADEQDV